MKIEKLYINPISEKFDHNIVNKINELVDAINAKSEPAKGYEILRCPLCNEIPIGVENTDDEYYVSCTNPSCSYSMQTFWKDTDIQAIAEWNRHVQMIKGK